MEKIQTENQLVSILAKKLPKFFNTDIVVTELAAGYGIVDLAFAKNFNPLKNKLNRRPINNYHSLKTVLSIPSNSLFNINDVMNICGISLQLSRRLLDELFELNYIEKIDKYYYRKTIRVKNPIKKIVAIEAKLKDWKRGAMQARRYKSFTDECYLALLVQYEKNIDYNYIDTFGIGLILYDHKRGDIIFKKKSKKNSVLSIYNEFSSTYAKEIFLHKFYSCRSN